MARERNLAMLIEAAAALRPVLGEDMVFVGGVTIGLLLPPDRASAVRATKDVDVVVSVRERTAYYALEARLRSAGLTHGIEPGDPICRWYKGDLALDIMPIDPKLLGFSNPFYERGYARATSIELPDGQHVRLMTPVDTFAAKTEAFADRGAADPWKSEDLEDLVALVDGIDDLVDALLADEEDIRSAAGTWARSILAAPDGVYWLEGHLPPGPLLDQRYARLLARVRRLAAG